MKNAEQLRLAAAQAEEAASRAKLYVESPVIRDAFARIEAFYIDAWRRAASSEQREEVFFRLKGLEAVQADLRAVISGGNVAAFNTRNLPK